MWHKRTAGIQKKHNAVVPPKKQQPTNHLWHKTPPHSKSIPRKWMAMMAMEFPQKGGFSPTFSTKYTKIVVKMGIESSPNFRRSENPPKKYLGVSKNRGTPKWIVYNGKPRLKWDDLRGKPHYFRKHPSDFTGTPRNCATIRWPKIFLWISPSRAKKSSINASQVWTPTKMPREKKAKGMRRKTVPFLELDLITSWWLNQPIWKICSSNWIISPSRGEHKKIFETTT